MTNWKTEPLREATLAQLLEWHRLLAQCEDHWDRRANGDEKEINKSDMNSCPLCGMYAAQRCVGCVIREATEQKVLCEGFQEYEGWRKARAGVSRGSVSTYAQWAAARTVFDLLVRLRELVAKEITARAEASTPRVCGVPDANFGFGYQNADKRAKHRESLCTMARGLLSDAEYDREVAERSEAGMAAELKKRKEALKPVYYCAECGGEIAEHLHAHLCARCHDDLHERADRYKKIKNADAIIGKALGRE